MAEGKATAKTGRQGKGPSRNGEERQREEQSSGETKARGRGVVQGSAEQPGEGDGREGGEALGRTSEVEGEPLAGLDRQTLHKLLEQMLLGRRFEEKCAEAYALGKIGGFCHLYIGQEAVAVGTAAALRPDDYMMTAYRDHVQALVKGMTAREVMAELYGRRDGCSRGKGGSMHMYSAPVNFMGGWGIVGGQIPLATGIAFAIKYRGGDQVCVCFFGEAAVNQGAFHESLNMAALWRLPVIYIVENNRFGMGTAWERASSLYDISLKACAYDMPRAIADGMDVLNMRQVVADAAERARRESMPTLVEARCYRFMGHSMSDPVHGVYRTKDEVEEAKSKDPIRIFIDRLREHDMLTDEELNAIDARVQADVDDAEQFAENSPDPSPEELYQHVYADLNVNGRLFFDGRGQEQGQGQGLDQGKG